MLLGVDVAENPGLAELSALAELATWSWCRWWLMRWAEGADVPCCTSCALDRVRYLPDSPARSIRLCTGTELLRRGSASCGELAAMEAGRLRALAIQRGEDAASARAAAHVELELTRVAPTSARTTDRTFHAVCVAADGTTWDPKDPHHG